MLAYLNHITDENRFLLIQHKNDSVSKWIYDWTRFATIFIMHSRSMKLELRLPQTGRHYATKENIISLAKEAKNAGFDSLWVLQRLIWLITPSNPYTGTSDGKFPADC